jgi:hypothetical protein
MEDSSIPEQIGYKYFDSFASATPFSFISTGKGEENESKRIDGPQATARSPRRP